MELLEGMNAVYLLLTTMAVFAISFLIARFMDPAYKCRQLRRWLKKPYVIVNLVQKDSLLINTYVVNAEKDVLIVDSNMWIVTAGSVYLKSKGKRQKAQAKGFKMASELLKQEEGAPTLYVDRDTMTPIGFYKPERGNVKPDEVGSTMLAWVFNQYQKAMAGVQHQKTLLIVIALLAALSLALGWTNHNDMARYEQKVNSIDAKLDKIIPSTASVLPKGATVEDGSIKVSNTGG